MLFVLFLLSFGYLLAGLSGTIPSYRDSGDLIASIHTLGIAHPPGYATYVTLGKTFDLLLPWGNASYHVNVFSAVSAAIACAVMAGAEPFHKRAVWAGGIAALLWILTPAATELGRVAEMYATSAAFAAAVMALLLADEPKPALAAFVWGLGLAVHPVVLFVAPMFWSAKLRDIPGMVLGAVLGISVFLYLPIRSLHHPWLNWGDPSSWRNFWRVVTRADYGGLKLHPEESVLSWDGSDLATQVSMFGKLFWSEWGWLGTGLGVVGAMAGLRTLMDRRAALAILASWVLCGPAFVFLSHLPATEPTTAAILQPYFVLNSLLWVPFVSAGLVAASGIRFWMGPALGLLALATAFTPQHLLAHREDFYAYDYGMNLLHALPLGAVLYDPDDPVSFTLHALQATEHRREDVVLLNFFRTLWGYREIVRQHPDLLPDRPMTNAQELERAFWSYSIRRRPFYVELPQKLAGMAYQAQGLAYQVQPVDHSSTVGEYNLMQSVVRGDAQAANHTDFFTKHLIEYYADAHCNLGLQEASAGDNALAIANYKAALRYDSELTAAYNDWAILEFNARHYATAIALYRRALTIEPHNAGLEKNLQIAQSAAVGLKN